MDLGHLAWPHRLQSVHHPHTRRRSRHGATPATWQPSRSPNATGRSRHKAAPTQGHSRAATHIHSPCCRKSVRKGLDCEICRRRRRTVRTSARSARSARHRTNSTDGGRQTSYVRGLSVLACTVANMSGRLSSIGGYGGYRVRCEPGFCATNAGPGTSKTERDIRELFKLVLGPIMPQSVAPPVDMAFDLQYGPLLAIEYDGAGWHKDREEQDRRKAERLARSGIVVVRIREDPLRPLRNHDVWVPARSSAQACVQLALHHIAHVTHWDEQRIAVFLAALPTSPDRAQLPCRDCWRVARKIRRATRTGHRWIF